MTLTEPKGCHITTIICACKHESRTYAEHYRHVVSDDCPILRCCHCLTWIVDPEKVNEHQCPKTVLVT